MCLGALLVERGRREGGRAVGGSGKGGEGLEIEGGKVGTSSLCESGADVGWLVGWLAS